MPTGKEAGWAPQLVLDAVLAPVVTILTELTQLRYSRYIKGFLPFYGNWENVVKPKNASSNAVPTGCIAFFQLTEVNWRRDELQRPAQRVRMAVNLRGGTNCPPAGPRPAPQCCVTRSAKCGAASDSPHRAPLRFTGRVAQCVQNLWCTWI